VVVVLVVVAPRVLMQGVLERQDKEIMVVMLVQLKDRQVVAELVLLEVILVHLAVILVGV
jgi:hypothetical protein